MNLRHQPHFAGDGESLQADVMRFMAIIGFCLMAVLALVKDAEPPQPIAPRPAPAPEPVVVVPEAQEPEHDMELSSATEVTEKFEKPLRKAESLLRSPPVVTSLPPPPRPRLPVPAKPPAGEANIPADGAEAPADDGKGLSLRFASDRDFLRLVTKGEIQVFAYQAHSVLGLGRNFEFVSTDSPGQVYELLPETIPKLIFAALDRATRESSAYTWGIRMPANLEVKIRGFVDRAVRGELVIDRYGEVHHVAS